MVHNIVLVGLTGSIGSGKSTVTNWLKRRQFPVFDADDCVHQLYEKEAVELVEQAFPGSTMNGKVNRGALLKRLRERQDGFKILENIIHPLVDQKKRQFLQQCQRENKTLCFFDIPLLFETGQQNMFDVTVVLTVTAENQQKRVLSRPGMTQDKLDLLLHKQLSTDKKIALAGHVLDNNGSIAGLEGQLEKLLIELKKMSGQAIINWDL